MKAKFSLPVSVSQSKTVPFGVVRICAWCNKGLGLTCPHCDSSKVMVEKSGQFHMGSCNDCTYIFPTGPAGATHGICNECSNTLRSGSDGKVSFAGVAA
jgi:hypothetical protein